MNEVMMFSRDNLEDFKRRLGREAWASAALAVTALGWALDATQLLDVPAGISSYLWPGLTLVAVIGLMTRVSLRLIAEVRELSGRLEGVNRPTLGQLDTLLRDLEFGDRASSNMLVRSNAAQREFDQVASAALAGDPLAEKSLARVAEVHLELYAKMYGSSTPPYVKEHERVTRRLRMVRGLLGLAADE